MQFKIAKTNIRITFFFAVGMTFFALWQGGEAVLSVLSAVLLHECTHVFCLYACHAAPKQITIGIFGMCMTDENTRMLHYKKELLCTLFAPLVNLVCFAALLPLTAQYTHLQTACAVHFSFGFFNLLPFRCLDGGRSLYCLLCLHYAPQKAEKVMNAAEWCFFFLFLFFLAVYFFCVRFEPTALVFLFYLSFLLFFRK